MARRAVGSDAVHRRRVELTIGERHAETRICEIKAAVRFAEDIVRAAEALPFEAVDQYLGGGEFAIRRPARQAAVAALAEDQPTLRVERRAVALTSVFAQQFGRATRADAVEFARPHIDKIIEAIGMPERAFGEDKTGREPLGFGLVDNLRKPVHRVSPKGEILAILRGNPDGRHRAA